MAVDALARAIAAGKTPVTAYDEAVKAGYTGTEEQFAQDMGNSGTNASNAAASASAAAASAESVAASAAQIATNTSDISDLKTQLDNNLNGVSKALDIQFYPFKYGGRYMTGTDGNQGTWTDNTNWCGMMIPCTAGETFNIKLYGGKGNTRIYQFMASDYSNLEYERVEGLQEKVVTAPANTAYAIFNNRLSDLPDGYYVYQIKDGFYKNTSENIAKIPVLEDEVNGILDSIGTHEEKLNIDRDTNYYWNSETNIAVKTAYDTYAAYNPYQVNPGEKYRITIYTASSAKQNAVLLVNDNFEIVERYTGTRRELNDFEITIPENVTQMLLTTLTSYVASVYKIVPNDLSELFVATSGLFDYKNANIAIIGDSISTNGNYSEDNPLGNIPEIVVNEADVGVQLSAYVTYYDVGTVIGGHTITESEVGTEITFTPTSSDIGKIVGKPLNNNTAGTNIWWENAMHALGFNPIPVCWSGSSITDHEENATESGHYIYKCAHAFHPSQIRKCGIRVPGSMTRIAPDMVIIYRGINDFSHTPYTLLTDYLNTNPISIPETDAVDGGYGYLEGLSITINKLREAYPETQIVLCTFNYFHRMSTTYPGFPSRNGINTIYQYNDAIRKLADFFGCGIIEFDKDGITYANAASGEYYNEGTSPTANHTHPNNKGHKVMGNRALRDLQNINSKV